MRKMSLTLALIVATGGILAGALGPALAEGDKLWPIVWILWAPVGYLDTAQATRKRRRHCRPPHRSPVGSRVRLAHAQCLVPSDAAAAWLELGDSIFGGLPWLAIVWLLLVFPSGAYAAEPTNRRLVPRRVRALTSVAFAVDPAPDGGHRSAQPTGGPWLGCHLGTH